MVQRSALPAGYALQLKRDERFNGCSNVSESNLLELAALSLQALAAKAVRPARNSCCRNYELAAASRSARATLRPQRDAFDAKQTRADALYTKGSQ